MLSIDYIKDKQIVIWGTGIHAVKCAYFLREKGIQVEGFFNSNPKIEKFLDRPVLEPSQENCRGKLIIVASVENVYIEISNILDGYGLVESVDYIFYTWLQKKIVLLHGNCHCSVIKDYLENSKTFCEKYTFYPHRLIHEGMKPIEGEMMQQIDVWLHQDIRPENKFGYEFSDEYMRKLISPKALEIVFPQLYGMGRAFFPQEIKKEDDILITKENSPLRNGADKYGMFLFVDWVIERALKETDDMKTIIDICKSDNCLRKDEIIQNFQSQMKKIYEREKQWDVKIYDFIVENYKKEKLFFDSEHPNNVVLKKISQGILEKMGIEERLPDISNQSLGGHEIPVYPATKYALEMDWTDDEIRRGKNEKKAVDRMSFEEYIREYVWWRSIGAFKWK